MPRSKPTYRATIDPGSAGTGVALWREDRWSRSCGPEYVRVFIPPRVRALVPPNAEPQHLAWEHRASLLAYQIQSYVFSVGHLHRAYIEQPKFFDSAGGHMVARRGDLAKLMMFTGMLHSMFRVSEYLPVNEWKGQMPKEVVNSRIRTLLGAPACEEFKSHVWDAVGMGLYLKGYMV